MPVQVSCNFHKDLTITKQAMLQTRSYMRVFGTKGQVTPKSIGRSGSNSLVQDFMHVQITCKFHKASIKIKQAKILTKFEYGVFSTKGQLTPTSIVRSCRNSNSFEILCLSSLSASLIKIRLKLKRLCSRQSQICFSALKRKELRSEKSDLARFRTRPRFYGCSGYLQV